MTTEAIVPRPEVMAFARLMELKLRENAHKGGRAEWLGCDRAWLLGRLREELTELATASRTYGKVGASGLGETETIETVRAREVGREAADVGNFAMMIADVCGALAEYEYETRATSPEVAMAHAMLRTLAASNPDESFWRKLSPELIFALVESAPLVAGPWGSRQGTWSRLRPSSHHVELRPVVTVRKAGRGHVYLLTAADAPIDVADTLEEAKAAADALLIARGWVLLP